MTTKLIEDLIKKFESVKSSQTYLNSSGQPTSLRQEGKVTPVLAAALAGSFDPEKDDDKEALDTIQKLSEDAFKIYDEDSGSCTKTTPAIIVSHPGKKTKILDSIKSADIGDLTEVEDFIKDEVSHAESETVTPFISKDKKDHIILSHLHSAVANTKNIDKLHIHFVLSSPAASFSDCKESSAAKSLFSSESCPEDPECANDESDTEDEDNPCAINHFQPYIC